MADLFKTPEELVSELIIRWPSTRVPISVPDVMDFTEHFKPNLTDDFDISVFALLMKGREEFTMSEPLLTESGHTAKILVTVAHDVWLAVVVRQNGYWKIQAFTFRCTRCMGQGFFYSGSELCPECGGTGWGATGDLEFRSGKRKIKAMESKSDNSIQS
jgi:rRNA maturation endonuclease Nob1